MLSRVADTIYWLARYMERTQAMLQVIRTHYIASQEELAGFSWRPLLYAYGDLSPEELRSTEHNTAKALEHLILDRQNAAAVSNNIQQARENARAVQDHITQDVWQCLNDYYHAIRDTQQVRHGDPVSSIDQLMRHGLVFTGSVKNTMPRDEGYAYLNLGKFVERAIQTCDTLRWAYVAGSEPQALDAPELRYLLQSVFGYDLYLRTYKGQLTPHNVLQLIMYNTQFPHSLLYNLNQTARYFERLKAESLPDSYQQVEFLIGKTRNNVKYTNFSADQPEVLNQFLWQTRGELLDVASALNKHFFGHS